MTAVPGPTGTGPGQAGSSLAGASVGVSGGGGHLGRALALGLAAAGATVVICGRSVEPLRETARLAAARSLSGSVIVEPGDVGVAADLARVLDRLDELGGVDGWVNNASAGHGGLLGSLDGGAVSAALGAMLGDLMVATDAVAGRMRARGRGSIVNVASMYALVSPQPGVYRDFPDHHSPPSYGAAKAGIVQFTRYAACHLAADGIRVNCVSPGAFPAPAVQRRKAFIAQLAARVPLGRIGKPDEIVGPVLFLLGDGASYVTGHNLVVDGGWTAW